MNTYQLTGNTYELRNEIKQLGCKWSSLGKFWSIRTKKDIEDKLKDLFNQGVVIKKDGYNMFLADLTPRNDLSFQAGMQVEIPAWLAKAVAKEHKLELCFRNLEVVEVYAESKKAVQAKVKFVSKVANSCHLCGRNLDTEISRATGIGPVCAKKLKLDRGTYQDAEACLKFLDTYASNIGEVGPIWIPKSQMA